MHEPIHIDDASEFFVALCKYQVHSFVVAGVKNGAQITLLASVGKQAVGGLSPGCTPHIPSAIKNEFFLFNNESSPPVRLNYKAYSIGLTDYLSFLLYLKSISLSQIKSSPIMAYIPSLQNPNILEWKSVHGYLANTPAIAHDELAGFQHITLGETCRHSAIKLIQHPAHLQNPGSGVSKFFLKKPPLKTRLASGKVDESYYPFYILPLPPAAFQGLTADKLKILSRIYSRLDQIILKEQGNPLTMEKFTALKALYQELIKGQYRTITDIVTCLEHWETEHKQLVSAPRNRINLFHHSTGTQRMFRKLHAEFPASISETQEEETLQRSP